MRLLIKGCLQSSTDYILPFFALSKGIDEAQSFFDYVLSTKLYFRILFSFFSCQLNAKCARKYLRDLRNLW